MTAKHWTEQHKRARREMLAAVLASGRRPRCAIGGELLGPDSSTWDLAHRPGTDEYMGFACWAHNRRTAANGERPGDRTPPKPATVTAVGRQRSRRVVSGDVDG